LNFNQKPPLALRKHSICRQFSL